MVDHLAGALTDVFGSIAASIISLITFRDGLRARLRASRPTGVPLLSEAGAMITAYLAAERDLGRIAPGADIDTLGLTLIGSGHLLSADREAGPPSFDVVRRLVASVLAGALIEG
jgi:hypothetical protein